MALQRTGYWLMDETEEIYEFVVSNNLLATTLGRPQLQHNHSIELLSWYALNIIVFMFIQGLWNHWSQLSHTVEGPILTDLWHFPQGNFSALEPEFISSEPPIVVELYKMVVSGGDIGDV